MENLKRTLKIFRNFCTTGAVERNYSGRSYVLQSNGWQPLCFCREPTASYNKSIRDIGHFLTALANVYFGNVSFVKRALIPGAGPAGTQPPKYFRIDWLPAFLSWKDKITSAEH